MKRIVAAVLITLAVGVSPAYAQDEEDAQATIAALETQVASLSGEGTPAGAPTAVELTEEERDYLIQAGIVVTMLQSGIRQTNYILSNPPSTTDDTRAFIAYSVATLAFPFARDAIPEAAPSARLGPFHSNLTSAIGMLVQVAIDLDGVLTETERKAARVKLDEGELAMNEAISSLDDIGLLTALQNAIDPPPSQGHHNLHGTVELTDADAPWDLSFCKGEGGYSDLEAGRQVTVTNAAGEIIGIGELGSGETQSPSRCLFRFVVRELPESTFYTLSIGRRPGPTYSFANLEAQMWVVSLSIGS
jgi:hypothetical protein